MPVRKFHSVEQMEPTVWHDPDDPALPRAIAATWALADRMCPRRFPPGVRRYRTIEEANRQREAWEAEAVRRLRK